MVDAADIGRRRLPAVERRTVFPSCWHAAIRTIALQQRIGTCCPAAHERIAARNSLKPARLSNCSTIPLMPLAVLQAARGLKPRSGCAGWQPQTGRFGPFRGDDLGDVARHPDMCRAFFRVSLIVPQQLAVVAEVAERSRWP